MMHISKSDQTKLSKTVSCFSFRNGITLAFKKICQNAYCFGISQSKSISCQSYWTESFLSSTILNVLCLLPLYEIVLGQLDWNIKGLKKYSSISSKSAKAMASHLTRKYEKKQKKVLMHHLFWSFLMPLWIVFQTFRLHSISSLHIKMLKQKNFKSIWAGHMSFCYCHVPCQIMSYVHFSTAIFRIFSEFFPALFSEKHTVWKSLEKSNLTTLQPFQGVHFCKHNVHFYIWSFLRHFGWFSNTMRRKLCSQKAF